MFRERFTQQADGTRIDGVAVAAVRSAADAVFKPARCTEFAHQMAAGCVDVLAVAGVSEMLAAPCFDACGEFAVAVFEERPRQRAVQIDLAGSAQVSLLRILDAFSPQTRDTRVRSRACSCRWPGLAPRIRSLRRCSCSIPGAASSW